MLLTWVLVLVVVNDTADNGPNMLLNLSSKAITVSIHSFYLMGL